MEAKDYRQSLLDAALAYSKRGWRVFPLRPRGKIPITITGCKAASSDPAAIRQWWNQNPEANIGIATGEGSGLAVVDIDPRHGGNESLDHLTNAFGAVPETLTAQTGGGGRHFYFKHIPGFRNSAGHLGKGIDTRGEGGYVVAPPSVHETGALYQWEDEDENREPLDMPEWFRLNGHTKQLAAGNLPFVAGPVKATGDPVEEGGRNNAAASLAGQYIQAGDSLATVLEKLRTWNKTNTKPLDDAEIEKTAASVARTHVTKNPAAIVPVADVVVEPDSVIARPAPSEFPVELLAPPGFVGQLCQWINETAIKPQPILALGNVLAFFGAVIGRKVRTPTDLRSNLYVLGVGESGCGKDHSRKAVKRLCEAAGLTGKLLGGEEVSSDSAVLSAVHSHPSILFQFDEIGHFLANANSRNAAVHQKNIAPTFTKLYSSANTTFIGKEYAGNRDREDIIQPNVCLYGTTVPGRLYEGLTPSEISDGFLGRMIVLQSDTPDPHDNDCPRVGPPPAPLVDLIKLWVDRQDLPRAEGNLASILEHNPIPVELSKEADMLYRAFRAHCRARKNEFRGNGGLDVLWSRAMEHALKVGLTVACGCEFISPIITGDVAGWSIRLVDHAVSALVETVKDSVAGSDFERQLLFVQKVITEAGIAGISRTHLLQRTRRLTARQRDEVLNALTTNETIAVIEEKGARGFAGRIYVRKS